MISIIIISCKSNSVPNVDSGDGFTKEANAESGIVDIHATSIHTEEPAANTSTLNNETLIECDDNIIWDANTSYPLDRIIPGKSTKEEVLALLGAPSEETEWEGKVTWLYKSQEYDSRIRFVDEQVVGRDDPRLRLDEIVTHYGVPDQLLWRLPKIDYHGSIPRTYLLYPEEGAMFVEERQITELTANTLFRDSFIVEPSQFDNFLIEFGILVENEIDEYQTIDWPCQ
jgi:hypothetical protein